MSGKDDDKDFMVVGQKKAEMSDEVKALLSLGKQTGETLLDKDKQGISAYLGKSINGSEDSFTLKGGGSTFGNTTKFGLDTKNPDPVRPTPRHDVYGGFAKGGAKSRLNPSQKNFSFGRGVPFSGGHLQYSMFKSRLAKVAIGNAFRVNPKFGFFGSEHKVGPTTFQGLKFGGGFPMMNFQNWSKGPSSTYHDAEEESDE